MYRWPPRCSTPQAGSKLQGGTRVMRRIVALGVCLALLAPLLPSPALAGGARPLAPRPLNAVGANVTHGGILPPLSGPTSAFGSPGGFPLPLPGSPEVRLAPKPVDGVPHRRPHRVDTGSRSPRSSTRRPRSMTRSRCTSHRSRRPGHRERVVRRLRLAHGLRLAVTGGTATRSGRGARAPVGRRVPDRALRAAARVRDALFVAVDPEPAGRAAGLHAPPDEPRGPAGSASAAVTEPAGPRGWSGGGVEAGGAAGRLRRIHTHEWAWRHRRRGLVAPGRVLDDRRSAGTARPETGGGPHGDGET